MRKRYPLPHSQLEPLAPLYVKRNTDVYGPIPSTYTLQDPIVSFFFLLHLNPPDSSECYIHTLYLNVINTFNHP